MAPTKILVLGSTGYIGGTLFLRLLKLADVTITALVRSPEKAAKLRQLNLGIEVVEGSPSTDATLISDLLKDTDLLIDAYDCDDFDGARNIVAGLKQSEKRTRVLHVSGTGVLMDDALGRDIPNPVWDDADVEQMASIPITQMHRNVDIQYVNADEEGAIYSYLVFPAAVFSNPRGILVDAGIQDADGKQYITTGIPKHVQQLGGEPAFYGGGHNHWSIVDLYELTDLLMLLVTKLLSPEWHEVPHGKAGYYFAENGDVELGQVATVAAEVLQGKKGLKARDMTSEEVKAIGSPELRVKALSANTRCTSTRARLLGWKPVKSTKEFLDDVEVFAKKLASTK